MPFFRDRWKMAFSAILLLNMCPVLSACGDGGADVVTPVPDPDPVPVPDSTDTVPPPYLLTGLPVCYVTTRDSASIDSRTEYVSAMLSIEQDGRTMFEDTLLSIRGRGHASWTDSPKHPYKLKLGRKAELFGMKPNRHFVLLANYFDKSLMRAAIGFRIGEMLECEWTPASRFVELVLNGEHRGCYQLTEAVRAGEDRIRVGKTGLIMKYVYPDRAEEEPFWIRTDMHGFHYGFIYPNEEDQTEGRLGYAKAVLDTLERVLYSPRREHEYLEYIDLTSWAKWYYQLNLLMQEEYNLYFVKDDDTEGSPVRMGPLWDFDWCLGSGYYDGEERPNPDHHLVLTHYFRQLAGDSLFMGEVARLHRIYGPRVMKGTLDRYRELRNLLQRSQALNFQLYPILDRRISVGAWPLGSWEAEVDCDRQFFINHYDFLTEVFSHDSLKNCDF